jgi:hypothetical protein
MLLAAWLLLVLISRLAYSSNLTMGAIRFFGQSMDFYGTIWRYNPGRHHLQSNEFLGTIKDGEFYYCLAS